MTTGEYTFEKIKKYGLKSKIVGMIGLPASEIRRILYEEGYSLGQDTIMKYRNHLIQIRDPECMTKLNEHFLNNEYILAKNMSELEDIKKEIKDRMECAEGKEYTSLLKTLISTIEKQNHEIALNMKRTGEWLTKVEKSETITHLDMNKFLEQYQKRFVQDHNFEDGKLVVTKPELIRMYKMRSDEDENSG